MKESDLNLIVQDTLEHVSKDAWDNLTSPDHPFLDFDFLRSMETSQVVPQGGNWIPRYYLAYLGSDLVGAIPTYHKTSMEGEFIFDNASYSFAQRLGIPSYPKRVIASPFTPASSGTRILSKELDKEIIIQFLLPHILEDSKKSETGLHFLFTSEEESEILKQYSFTRKVTYQFHWINRGYISFEDYLNALNSKRRSSVKKERSTLAKENLTIKIKTGQDISESDLRDLYYFYHNTNQSHWGSFYFNEKFFIETYHKMRDRLVLVLAYRGDQSVGGTFNFKKGKVLYGRYWGQREYIPNLHFECCFYQLIEYAIDNKLEKFEAGAQGTQKFLRGFETTPIYSSHLYYDKRLNELMKNYLSKEEPHMLESIEDSNKHSPLKEWRSFHHEKNTKIG